jgi:organic radical activating enzyme
MFYSEIKEHDIANGEGVRTSLFVSGCRLHCRDCFNRATWDFSYGSDCGGRRAVGSPHQRILNMPESLRCGKAIAYLP